MESTVGKRRISRRPGGRTADITERVRQAVVELAIEGGFQACTFSNVAERAGVQRSTLYRRFPDRWATIIDAFLAKSGNEVVAELTGSFEKDLRSVLKRLAATLDTPLGPAVMAIAARLQADSDADYPRDYFDGRMGQLEPMFEAAIARGDLPADVDREELFTAAAGPLWFRKFIAGRPLDSGFIDRVVENVCWLYCSGARPSRGEL